MSDHYCCKRCGQLYDRCTCPGPPDAELKPTTLVAFDGGIRNTGVCVGVVAPAAPRGAIEHTETIKTDPSLSDDERIHLLASRALEIVDKWRPIVVSVEAHAFFANEQGRSQNKQLTQTSRVSGVLEGIGRFNAWNRNVQAGLSGFPRLKGRVYVIQKTHTHQAAGLHGKVPATRVRDFVEAVFKINGKRGGLLSDAHQVDASLLFWVSVQRWLAERLVHHER